MSRNPKQQAIFGLLGVGPEAFPSVGHCFFGLSVCFVGGSVYAMVTGCLCVSGSSGLRRSSLRLGQEGAEQGLRLGVGGVVGFDVAVQSLCQVFDA